LDLVDETMELQ